LTFPAPPPSLQAIFCLTSVGIGSTWPPCGTPIWFSCNFGGFFCVPYHWRSKHHSGIHSKAQMFEYIWCLTRIVVLVFFHVKYGCITLS
jgi:hypothetical protein